jgi:hypothetical protein
MNSDRRNPYVILGTPFGATEASARSGFASKIRYLRTENAAKFTHEDLNWALHQIEQLISDPSLAVNIYRIPANPESLAANEFGAFNPEAHPLERRSGPSTDADYDEIRRRCIAERLVTALGTSARVRLNGSDDPYGSAKED